MLHRLLGRGRSTALQSYTDELYETYRDRSFHNWVVTDTNAVVLARSLFDDGVVGSQYTEHLIHSFDGEIKTERRRYDFSLEKKRSKPATPAEPPPSANITTRPTPKAPARLRDTTTRGRWSVCISRTARAFSVS